jgi:hypothetical protein
VPAAGAVQQAAAVPAPAAQAGPPVSQNDILEFCRRLAPFEVRGFDRVRLGNANDGGYVFIDDFAEVSTVISCGISNDVTCDLAFADLGKQVLQFDHTVEGPPVAHPNFRFHKQAIARSAISRAPCRSRRWRAAGDPQKADLLLKIDIDGGEWQSFASFPPAELRRFRQIACEFHWSSRTLASSGFWLCEGALRVIDEQFFPVYLHGNNFVGFANVRGVPIPEVFEVTFVNRAIYQPGNRLPWTPTALDAPNNPDAPDLFLGSPFFHA